MSSLRERDRPTPEETGAGPVASAVAVAGHPLHAMSVHFPIAFVIATLGCDLLLWWSGDAFWRRAALWACGAAFVSGVAAGLVGTAELLLVRGIRRRVASWTHGVAAVMLIAIIGANWLLRLVDPAAVLPQGLFLSALASMFAGIAGWHGGKLVFDHGIGLVISGND